MDERGHDRKLLHQRVEFGPLAFTRGAPRRLTEFDATLIPAILFVQFVICVLLYLLGMSVQQIAPIAAILIIVGLAISWFWLFDGRLYWWAKKWFRIETARDRTFFRKREAVFRRLRLGDEEAIVFDPESNRVVPNNPAAIARLIDEIAKAEFLRDEFPE